MQKNKWLIFLILNAFAFSVAAQQINLGLFVKQNPKNIILTIQNGSYKLCADTVILDTLFQGSNISLSYEQEGVICHLQDTSYYADSLFSFETDSIASFFINYLESGKKARCYNSNLKVIRTDAYLQAINNIDLETYVAAVVEAEAGYNLSLEYYKTQAVICRTYAVSHIDRHKDSGFDLCDDVHCQVYPYKSMKADIREAVQATKGMVLVDSTYTPIIAAYHSNSGGITMNSEDVWVSAVSYLRSVVDSSSLKASNAIWEKEVNISDWRSFLLGYGVLESISDADCMVLEAKRQKNILISSISISSVDFRRHFKLRSAYFSTKLQANTVIISGKGYGHGVGLSQQGAMSLANEGWDYQSILKFYYTEVYVVKLQTVEAFQKLK